MNLSKLQTWMNQKIINWKVEYHQHGKSMLKSGLGYGLGLALGAVISNLLFRTVDPNWFIDGNDAKRLAVGLILAFVIMGLGGGVSGFIGGLTLPVVEGGRQRGTTAAMSALGMAVLFSLLIFPLILVIGLLSYYDVAELRPRLFGFVLGLIGLLYGLLMGLWLGVTTIGSWRAGRVARPAAIGFGLGGFLLGCSVWVYLYTLSSRDLQRSGWIWLLLGLFAFAALGGSALGLAYDRLNTQSEDRQPLQTTFRRTIRRYWLIALLLILAAWYLKPIFAAIGDMLTPYSAGLASILPSQTLGTHWSDPISLPEEAGLPARSQPALYAAPSSVVVTWVQADAGRLGEVYYSAGARQPDGAVENWQTAVNVSASLELDSSAPQVVVDESGIIYLAWVEELAPQQSAILVARCQDGICGSPVLLSAEQDGLDCSWTKPEDRQQNTAPRLTINGNKIMLTWHSTDQMLYSTWSTLESEPKPEANCLLLPETASNSVSLVAGPGDGFSLAYAAANDKRSIYQVTFTGQSWGAPQPLGLEGDPALYVDDNGNSHVASCGLDKVLYYKPPQGSLQQVSSASCLGSPALLFDSQSNFHLLWVSQSVANTAGNVSSGAVLYETKQVDGAWQPEALVFAGTSTPEALTQFAAMQDSSGVLHLVWPATELENSLGYAAQVQYSCPALPENTFAKTVFQAAALYRSPQDPPPYCGNRYDRMIFAPNPNPAFSDQMPSPNGVFDKLGESIRQAHYEVLLSTMWYEADLNQDSPGAVVASAVADLYRQVKEHPERYPRGMTVRILLGNPPEVVMDETSDQLWSLLNDLRNAGVEEMSNPQIGWQVETANFEGALPHSHSKMLIVDGATIVAAGFNFEYYHFPVNHPSGLGEDRWDLAMQISGPVAQDAMSAFDDLWQDSNGRACNFHPSLDLAWETTCQNYAVKSVHIPEVLKYYLPGGSADAFSMFRTEAHAESDAEVVAVVAAAQNSVDLTHVNFTLQLVCDLNVLYDVCNYHQAMSYYDALLQAAENGAHLRIMVSQESIDGVEATLGLKVFLDEAARRGLSDQIEVRFFNGWMHFKTTLVDDQFLVVGSQNYHYSAFGEGTGLAEYSLGTDDPHAIEDYKRLFEYHWERALPFSQ